MHMENQPLLADIQLAKPQLVAQKLLDHARVIDVREINEWNLVNIPGSIHVHHHHMASKVTQFYPNTHDTIVVYCAAGQRSSVAAQQLVDLGYLNVFVIEGGIEAWIRAKLPTSSARVL